MDDHLHGKIEEAARIAVRDELSSQMGQNRYINLERVPLICQSIVRIDKSIEGIQGNILWATRLIVGTVLAAMLGMILTQT